MKQLKTEAEQKRKAAMQKELERQQAFLQVGPSQFVAACSRGHGFQSRHTRARAHTLQCR